MDIRWLASSLDSSQFALDLKIFPPLCYWEWVSCSFSYSYTFMSTRICAESHQPLAKNRTRGSLTNTQLRLHILDANALPAGVPAAFSLTRSTVAFPSGRLSVIPGVSTHRKAFGPLPPYTFRPSDFSRCPRYIFCTIGCTLHFCSPINPRPANDRPPCTTLTWPPLQASERQPRPPAV